MTNQEKQTYISPWIDPEERVTVQFLDARDLNATVTHCTDQLVDVSIETHVPYMQQKISVPLSQVEVSEDELPTTTCHDHAWMSPVRAAKNRARDGP